MLLNFIENLIVDDMTPKQVRYVKPVTARSSKGRVKSIYNQIRSDFQLVPPLTMFSPSPDLLAGVWSIWRESQFAVGKVPRPMTEAVAAAVSTINVCPYCVDAHTGMLHASANHEIVKAIHEKNSSLIEDNQYRNIVDWALASRSPTADILLTPPFTDEEAPEIIGTAVVYHFVNRMVTIFLSDSPLPVPSGQSRLRRLAVKIFGATLAKSMLHRKPLAGKSLTFISNANLPDDLSWAISNKNVSSAFAWFSTLVHEKSLGVISPQVRELTLRYIDTWQGEDMPMNRNWMEDRIVSLEEQDKTVARLTLLTALAPYQISETDISTFKQYFPTDNDLLATTTWASFTAARRISRWLAFS